MRVVERTALKTANREYKLAARRAMRSEIVRGFIELVLNSDDSYQRLGATSGSIVVGVKKKRNRQGATIWVRDAAEGMDLERLKAAVGEYGKAVSGIYEGRSVRGYFGHGLKDAILGLGAGRIVSFKDGTMVMATLSFDRKGEPVVTYYEPARATPKLRAAHGVEANGTLVTIEVEPGVSIPQCDTLRDQLSRHYMLRRVMSQPTRTATLVYTTVVSGTEEQPLAYLEPVVDAVLVDEDIQLSGGGAARVVVKRATVQLESPRGQPLADGGFLVGSETAVFDHELFRFEGAEGAEYLFGEVIYPGLDDMLRRDEPILSATRDGLMWEYEALKPLRQAVESRLAVVVDAERRRRREEEAGTRNRELRDRVASAIRELNRIADAELIQIGGFGTGRGRSEPPRPGEPPVPESGFGFLYEFANVLIDKRASLLLRASADVIEPATAVTVVIDNPTDFELQTAQCVLEPRDDYPTVLEARVYVEGKRAGSECIVTASGAERQAEILCRVVTKQTPPRPPSGGLVNDVKFDSRDDPLSRVRFDKETGNVFVSTRSPSVALYMSPNGDGAEQGEGAVLIAELVLEAVCREIARRGVEAGTFVAPEGGEAEAMQRVFANLQNKYGAVIHRCFAGPAPAGTRGRPTAREAAERAVVPV